MIAVFVEGGVVQSVGFVEGPEDYDGTDVEVPQTPSSYLATASVSSFLLQKIAPGPAEFVTRWERNQSGG